MVYPAIHHLGMVGYPAIHRPGYTPPRVYLTQAVHHLGIPHPGCTPPGVYLPGHIHHLGYTYPAYTPPTNLRENLGAKRPLASLREKEE